MTFSTEQILLIIAALGVALVNIINTWPTNAKVSSVDVKADAIKHSVDGTATKQEQKLESALKQNADLQATNKQIIDMMRSLLEAEATDKKDIVRAIEINGSGKAGERGV